MLANRYDEDLSENLFLKALQVRGLVQRRGRAGPGATGMVVTVSWQQDTQGKEQRESGKCLAGVGGRWERLGECGGKGQRVRGRERSVSPCVS
jgi:hypothetical protein